MGLSICGVNQCFIRKYLVCQPFCTQNVLIDFPDTSLEPRLRNGTDVVVPYIIACENYPSGFVPDALQSGYLTIERCGNPFCPSTIFVEIGLNTCNASSPSIDPHTVEDACGPGAPACFRSFMIRLACNFKGRFTVQYCCEDETPLVCN